MGKEKIMESKEAAESMEKVQGESGKAVDAAENEHDVEVLEDEVMEKTTGGIIILPGWVKRGSLDKKR